MSSYEVIELCTNEYGQWDLFVDESPQGNIFNKSWWIQTITNDFKILVCKERDLIVGGIILPFEYGSFYKNPKLTPTLGILFRDFSKLSQAKQESKKIRIMTELIQHFPRFKYFNYSFSINFNNWLPFKWENYQIDVGYTYILEELSDLNKIFNGFKPNIKSDIKKAINNGISVKDTLSVKEFYHLNEKSYKRQGLEAPYSESFITDLDQMLLTKGMRKILFAIDIQGKIHAAAYLIYDQKSTYYLMGGGDPELRNSGATSLVLWEAIKFAATVSKTFDFEGSSLPNIESFFRAFGGTPKPIFRIYKGSKIVLLLISLLKKHINLLRKFGLFK